MIGISQTPETLAVAFRLFCGQDALAVLADKSRFLAAVMAFGERADRLMLRDVADLDDYREALRKAPPGLFNPMTWTYWNLKCGIDPVPPLPKIGMAAPDTPAGDRAQAATAPCVGHAAMPTRLRLPLWGSRIPRLRRRFLAIARPLRKAGRNGERAREAA